MISASYDTTQKSSLHILPTDRTIRFVEEAKVTHTNIAEAELAPPITEQ